MLPTLGWERQRARVLWGKGIFWVPETVKTKPTGFSSAPDCQSGCVLPCPTLSLCLCFPLREGQANPPTSPALVVVG